MAGQSDPMEAQREIEALQRVVARISEYARRRKPPPPNKDIGQRLMLVL